MHQLVDTLILGQSLQFTDGSWISDRFADLLTQKSSLLVRYPKAKFLPPTLLIDTAV